MNKEMNYPYTYNYKVLNSFYNTFLITNRSSKQYYHNKISKYSFKCHLRTSEYGTPAKYATEVLGIASTYSPPLRLLKGGRHGKILLIHKYVK